MYPNINYNNANPLLTKINSENQVTWKSILPKANPNTHYALQDKIQGRNAEHKNFILVIFNHYGVKPNRYPGKKWASHWEKTHMINKLKGYDAGSPVLQRLTCFAASLCAKVLLIYGDNKAWSQGLITSVQPK